MMKRFNAGGTLAGMLIGLVVGVLLSLGVVWYLNKMPIPFQDKTNHGERAATDAAAAPVTLPGKPGDKVADKPAEKPADKEGDKPRFEFYKILPGNQEATPTAAKPEAKPAAEPMFLQAGAFQKPADADNLKAKLALLGIEATVQEADVADKGKVFRVRVGPFSTADELNRVRAQLSQDGVTTNPVRNN